MLWRFDEANDELYLDTESSTVYFSRMVNLLFNVIQGKTGLFD